MFSVAYRDEVRNFVLKMAKTDERISSGAIIGSLASGNEDRWSDIDLTFGVRQDTTLRSVLEDWSRQITQEFSSAHLFDLKFGSSVYRVFLLPGCLQLDISFTPISEFGATGPNFKLLFGTSIEKPHLKPQSTREIFGYAVHHALRAGFCIARGRLWQAEYWISASRDHALTLACINNNLNPFFGRGYDDLPQEVLDYFKGSFSAKIEKSGLLISLKSVVTGLLKVTDKMEELNINVRHQLDELIKLE